MRHLLQLTLCIALVLAFRQIHAVQRELRDTKAKQKDLIERVQKQADATQELPGIVRRLGVRVGRIEEHNGLTPQP